VVRREAAGCNYAVDVEVKLQSWFQLCEYARPMLRFSEGQSQVDAGDFEQGLGARVEERL